MMRDPLMLSDTAMVLLRRYQQFDEDTVKTNLRVEELRRLMPLPDSNPDELFLEIEAVASRYSEIRDECDWIEYELMTDLWLCWSWPDLAPIRHLDWHLVLEGDLLRELNDLLVSVLTPPRNGIVMAHRQDIEDFFDRVLGAIKAKQKDGNV